MQLFADFLSLAKKIVLNGARLLLCLGPFRREVCQSLFEPVTNGLHRIGFLARGGAQKGAQGRADNQHAEKNRDRILVEVSFPGTHGVLSIVKGLLSLISYVVGPILICHCRFVEWNRLVVGLRLYRNLSESED